jgi:uncharacterized protein (DUF488 family)
MQKTIATIGYEKSSLPAFIVTLKDAQIEMLLDIRAIPFSRKPGFSKESLESALREQGIDYVHLKGLGNPRKLTKDMDNRPYEEMFAAHLKTTPALIDMARAIEIARLKRAALFCFERDPQCCHRSMVAADLVRQTKQDIEHLFVGQQQRDLFAS